MRSYSVNLLQWKVYWFRNLKMYFIFLIILRFLGGMADVAAWGAVLSIMMKLFPNKVARIVSLTEMFFGLGYMLGKLHRLFDWLKQKSDDISEKGSALFLSNSIQTCLRKKESMTSSMTSSTSLTFLQCNFDDVSTKQQHSSESFMQMCQNITQSPDLLFKLP